MNQTDALLDLINAIKKNDHKEIDLIIKCMIDSAEKRKQYKLAKKLREVYSNSSHNANICKPSGGINIDNNKQQLFEIRKSKINSSQIILSSVNQGILTEVLENYKKRDILKQHGLANDSRIILHGPPGTGKTLFAYALAGELKLPIYHVYLDALISSYLGETGKNLKIIFEEASREECVLLLDEFDAIAKRRDDSQELGELKRVVTVLLQNIDELNQNTILVAATNHEYLLDPAIWRRFDYSIQMDVLDLNSRKMLIDFFLNKNKNINIDLLANLAEGLSGAVIKQIINRSLRKSILDKNKDLQLQLIENFLIINAPQEERLKGSKRENFIKAIKYLRELNQNKYTYEELERITGIPSSTLHNISAKS